ncbi:hypothetical protein AG1IA_09023 [Rhizoctonia solani AG-1 IA]|uniref:Mitochondrial pyruvate carrier n=1 Tax=Thanatephorus cucumeris (strain AG1-IA) TaxID=983506 RepID=L8WJN9_THACA|nr:hypothetical protein AG1IA_09023 [Rhizoctonia solani AG-1 IA]
MPQTFGLVTLLLPSPRPRRAVARLINSSVGLVNHHSQSHVWTSKRRHGNKIPKIHESSSRRPKTVFFWAPLMKWCLVAAGLKDLSRPPDKLSVSQNVALAGTGFIWVRYSLVITPVNYSLAARRVSPNCTGSGISGSHRRKNPAPLATPKLAAD